MLKEITRERVDLVHDDDMEILLRKLQIYDTVKRGEFKCKMCHEPVMLENIYVLFPQGGDIKIICDKQSCVKEFLEIWEDIRLAATHVS